MIQRLQNMYLTKVQKNLSEQFHYKNTHEIPRLEKIVINRGVGIASQNAKLLESLADELTILAGQRPVVKRAKKAIAGFSIREEMPIGLTVTLRGERMYAVEIVKEKPSVETKFLSEILHFKLLNRGGLLHVKLKLVDVL